MIGQGQCAEATAAEDEERTRADAGPQCEGHLDPCGKTHCPPGHLALAPATLCEPDREKPVTGAVYWNC